MNGKSISWGFHIMIVKVYRFRQQDELRTLAPPLNFEMHHQGELISSLWHIHTSQTQSV